MARRSPYTRRFLIFPHAYIFSLTLGSPSPLFFTAFLFSFSPVFLFSYSPAFLVLSIPIDSYRFISMHINASRCVGDGRRQHPAILRPSAIVRFTGRKRRAQRDRFPASRNRRQRGQTLPADERQCEEFVRAPGTGFEPCGERRNGRNGQSRVLHC